MKVHSSPANHADCYCSPPHAQTFHERATDALAQDRRHRGDHRCGGGVSGSFAIAGQVLLLGFAGILLAIFLRTMADLLTRWTPFSNSWALAVVVVVLSSVLGLCVWTMGNRIAGQFDELMAAIPHSIQHLREDLQQYEWGKWVMDRALAATGQELSQVLSLASTTMDFAVDIVVILFVGIYCAAEPQVYQAGALKLVPLAYRNRAKVVLETLGYNLRWWMLGQLFSMFVIGVGVGIALWIIGAPLALVLGVLAGFLEIVPNIGPVLWLVPATLVALTAGPHEVLYVFIVYTAIHGFESYVLIPLVQRCAVWLPPALSILMVVLMSLVAGVLGLFVAAPLTVVVMVLTEMLYVEDWLGDRSVRAPGEKR